MKKFIVSLFSNRFGIVLATVNVCYFASRVHNFRPQPLDMPFACANSPAIIATVFFVDFLNIFIPKLSFQTKEIIGIIFAGAFVTLQWLFIAWIAKTLAAKLRPKKL